MKAHTYSGMGGLSGDLRTLQLEQRVSQLERFFDEQQTQLRSFSDEISVAFNNLTDTKLAALETAVQQQQAEVKQLQTFSLQLRGLMGNATSLSSGNELAKDISMLRVAYSNLKSDHVALQMEHKALNECLLSWPVLEHQLRDRFRMHEGLRALESSMADDLVLSKVWKFSGDKGIGIASLSVTSRVFQGLRSSVSSNRFLAYLQAEEEFCAIDEGIWERLRDFEPSPDELDQWAKSETVQGSLPGIRVEGLVGLSNVVSFSDVYALFHQLGLSIEQFVDQFIQIPCTSEKLHSKDLQQVADRILHRFASNCVEWRDAITCQDLYRLLVVLGFSLRRFKTIMNGVEEPDECAPRNYEQVGVYNLHRQMGSGHKGACCYLGVHIANESSKVAIKWPAVDAEIKVLQKLQSQETSDETTSKSLGIPLLVDSGIHRGQPYLAMELLGSTLTKVFRCLAKNPLKLRWRAICIIGRLVIRRLRYLHANGYVHCDISPENILLGRVHSCSAEVGLYLIDFEHAQVHPNGPEIRGVGSMEWSSIRSAVGGPRLPEDDLEALGWVLLTGLWGDLPWFPWLEAAYKNGDWSRNQVNMQVQRAKIQLLDTGRHNLGWKRYRTIPPELLRYLRACGQESSAHENLDYESLLAFFGGRSDLSLEEAERADLLEFVDHVIPLL